MRILVTGACGFIGSHVAEALMAKGHDVVGCDDLSFGSLQNIPELMVCAVNTFDNMDELDDYFDVVVHMATANIIFGMKHPVETMKINAEKTLELFGQFSGKIIYTSTSSVYGCADTFPITEKNEIRTYNAYDVSKRVAELYLQGRGDYTTLRLTNTYGPRQNPYSPYSGVVSKLVNCAMTGQMFEVYGNTDSTRDYCYVSDTVDAIVRATELPSLETEINVGTGVETSMTELVSKVMHHFKLTELPVRGVKKRAIDDVARRCVSNHKAKVLLDWEPIRTLDEGIALTAKWLKEL